MAAMKKGTKLTDKPKDYMLRVRMDKETVKKLDTICEYENITRSEAVRQGIEDKFSQIKKWEYSRQPKTEILSKNRQIALSVNIISYRRASCQIRF